MEHRWTTPRGRTPDIKFCIRCDITYAAFLGSGQECKGDGHVVQAKLAPKPPRTIPKHHGERPVLLDDDEPLEAKDGNGVLSFRKPRLPYIPERRGCKGLYCATRAEHEHTSGGRIIYI